jgi:2-polyprenyl-3-methyl-5-hydroxy-6-metoxy-1,4-benzoquinol methylase
MTDDAPRYGFGANWQRYLAGAFDEERAEIARAWLTGFLGRDRLDGLSFLDIGSGSGLHSLGAWRSGAARVVSFDYDPNSVEATSRLHRMVGAPANWEIFQGSILDPDLPGRLGTFDVVYSWGVLHHTGDQWTALDNAVAMLAPDGLLYVALYTSDQYVDPPPEHWLALKRRYNRAGAAERLWMEAAYVWRHVCHRSWRAVLRLPATARAYRASRGMALITDVRDWLGGWPMEFSSVREVLVRGRDRYGLELARIKTGEGNTEYLFAHPAALARFGLEAQPDGGLGLLLHPVRSLRSDLPADRPFLIFGTGRGGVLLVEELARNGGPSLAGFVDLTPTADFRGRPVFTVETLETAFPPDIPIVLSNRWVTENAGRLRAAGFGRLYNAHPLVMALGHRHGIPGGTG